MNYAIDASVAVKWFIQEDLHEKALELIDPEIQLIAPDLIICEITNTVWKKCIRGEITPLQAETIAGGLNPYFSMLYPAIVLNERALKIGLALNHPIYDCLYIACAETSESVLVTDDRRLINAVSGTDFEKTVVSLGDPDTPHLPL